MNPFNYAFSLRVEHPSLRAEEISTGLGLEPSRSWSAGDPRLSPAATPLEGIHDSTYWTARLSEEEGVRDHALLNVLAAALERLEERKVFLDSIPATGGSLSVFLGLVGEGNFGISLPPDLLGRLAALRIHLELDVYP